MKFLKIFEFFFFTFLFKFDFFHPKNLEDFFGKKIVLKIFN